ncbi:hypothetical protein ADUPG1_006146 [Aduncisulcus paluster]|uniref:Uncharacterized protein n=1 Tax=Aduncisulcus paluster TaxID=2918883 RepID=A0ABQ5KH20_9EUKA|nr:hypothetical protein ADUPG1_006146 [Aduncisulcus paluster]
MSYHRYGGSRPQRPPERCIQIQDAVTGVSPPPFLGKQTYHPNNPSLLVNGVKKHCHTDFEKDNSFYIYFNKLSFGPFPHPISIQSIFWRLATTPKHGQYPYIFHFLFYTDPPGKTSLAYDEDATVIYKFPFRVPVLSTDWFICPIKLDNVRKIEMIGERNWKIALQVHQGPPPIPPPPVDEEEELASLNDWGRQVYRQIAISCIRIVKSRRRESWSSYDYLKDKEEEEEEEEKKRHEVELKRKEERSKKVEQRKEEEEKKRREFEDERRKLEEKIRKEKEEENRKRIEETIRKELEEKEEKKRKEEEEKKRKEEEKRREKEEERKKRRRRKKTKGRRKEKEGRRDKKEERRGTLTSVKEREEERAKEEKKKSKKFKEIYKSISEIEKSISKIKEIDRMKRRDYDLHISELTHSLTSLRGEVFITQKEERKKHTLELQAQQEMFRRILLKCEDSIENQRKLFIDFEKKVKNQEDLLRSQMEFYKLQSEELQSEKDRILSKMKIFEVKWESQKKTVDSIVKIQEEQAYKIQRHSQQFHERKSVEEMLHSQIAMSSASTRKRRYFSPSSYIGSQLLSPGTSPSYVSPVQSDNTPRLPIIPKDKSEKEKR